MKIVLVRSSCGNGRTCPNINRSDRDTWVVQGWKVTGNQSVVEVPISLLPEVVALGSRVGLEVTDHETVLVTGIPVTDVEVLAELKLPSNEGAVEIDHRVLAELEAAA